jgi:hypothetical protein
VTGKEYGGGYMEYENGKKISKKMDWGRQESEKEKKN